MSAAGSINHTWPKELWKPENTFIFCRSLAGLQEKIDHLTTRVRLCALAILGGAAIAVAGAFAPFSVSALIVGGAIVGAVAALALCVQFLIQRTYARSWFMAFENLVANRFDLAENQFKELLKPDASKDVKNALVCLSPVYGSIYDKTEGNNYQSPYFAVGHALLMILCNKANESTHPKDWSEISTKTQEWDTDLEACSKYFDEGRNNLVNGNAKQILEDLKTKSPPQIRLPHIKSPGHGLLLTVFDWIQSVNFNLTLDFNEKGELINHRGANLEYLKGWQETVKKAQQWMEREHLFGDLEKTIVKSLLEAKNMREFVQDIKLIESKDLATLTERMIEY